MTALPSRLPDPRPKDAELTVARVVTKPWGHEVIYTDPLAPYVGKIITVNPGHALSTQFHHDKEETMHVLSGMMELGTAPRGSAAAGGHVPPLTMRTLGGGWTVHLAPCVVHSVRCHGDEPLVFAEVSTAFDGWQEDIVRLSDPYGRAGATAP